METETAVAVRVAAREHVDGVTTIHFAPSTTEGRLISLVPGYGIGEAAYDENDSRRLPPNIVLKMDFTNGTPLSISFPMPKSDGSARRAWQDRWLNGRLEALLGEALFRHIALDADPSNEGLDAVAIQRWRNVADVRLGDYTYLAVNAALGLEGRWMGPRYV